MIENIHEIEYFDTTEYFNIDTGTIHSNDLNKRYWETSQNENNINAFSNDEISNFYQNTLNCKDKISNIDNFLCSLYEYGASKIHINNGSIIYTNDNNQTDQYDILMSYGGQDITYHPYYNHKNTIHPSFQLHPYL